MKVAILAPFQDGTGYSHGAVNLVLCAEAAGLDVVCRSITMSAMNGREYAKKISHLHDKDLENVDAVIQVCLPHTFEYKGGVKNIGYFYWETDSFKRSGWQHNCNMMDEIWVPCPFQKDACIKSGVTVPIKVVPFGIDLSKYSRLTPLEFSSTKKFIFYTVCENNRRKNIPNLIRSYYLGFTRHDDVLLILKVAGAHDLENVVAQIKKEIHLYPSEAMYPPIICIKEFVDESILQKLHSTGDCFITASKGESVCIPAIDALAYGNPVIAPKHGAFLHYISSYGGHLVDGSEGPCFGMQNTPRNYYAGDENWFEININDMAKKMRRVYNKEISFNAKLNAEKFSIDKVSQIIKDTLNAK